LPTDPTNLSNKVIAETAEKREKKKGAPEKTSQAAAIRPGQHFLHTSE